jgi:uncharacterized protein (TIGR02996 family)
MSMLEQFLSDLEQSPDDWTLRGVFADWCEDNQQVALAACLRWMAQHHKRPHRSSIGRATWFNADKITTGLGDPESDVPGMVFERLEGGHTVANYREYPSHRAAEQAFHAAWLAAHREGWNTET